MPRARSIALPAAKGSPAPKGRNIPAQGKAQEPASRTDSPAPKGRNIPAQGNALGSRHPKNLSPEGAAQGGKWPTVPLSDLAVSMKNGIYKHASAYAEDGIPCLRMYNIEDGHIVWKDIKRMRLTRAELDDYGLLPGDLLVNRVNSRELVGKTAPIPNSLGPCVFESKNIRVRLDHDRVDPKWASYKFLLDGNRYFERNAQQVVGMASINQTQLGNFPIPLPPLPEQRRIVARIEELFSRLDAGAAALRHAKAQLQRYRQSVLAAAVTGQLTQAWREQHPDTEPAETLLKRILEQRREQWDGRGKYREPISYNSSPTFELPDSWAWSSLDQLMLNITDGDHQAPPQTDSGIPFLVIGNIRSGSISFEGCRFVGADYYKSLDRFRIPSNGDILYSLVGSFGIAVPVKSDDPFCVQRHIGILRPHSASPSAFISHALNSWFVYQQASDVSTGTAQKTVPLSGLRRIAMPLPPLAEQHQIVAEVETRTTAIDHLEAELDRQITRSNRLRQSTLAAAFSGKLI